MEKASSASWDTPPGLVRHSSHSSTHTFLLMLIYFQLPLLLQSQGVDYGNSQPESFSGVAVGAQGVHPSAGCRDVFCKARTDAGARLSQRSTEIHGMVLMGGENLTASNFTAFSSTDPPKPQLNSCSLS